MIAFTPRRTRRISVRMRELTLKQAMSVCRIPAEEAALSEFLRHACADAAKPTDMSVTDPRLWTVQERAMMLAHYLSAVSPDGANFAIGDSARLSDYLDVAADYGPATVDLGTIAGTRYTCGHLLGVHAELLERVCTTFGAWVHGMIACCVFRRT